MTITQKKKTLLATLGDRFTTIEHDGGYLLFDKEQEAHLTQQSYGKYIGQIYLSSNGDSYVYREVRYKTVAYLLKAIADYNATLPFDIEIYNPSYIPSYRIEAGLNQYLKSLGFTSDFGSDNYVLKDLYGKEVCTIQFEVDRESTNGHVIRFSGDSKWQESEFTDLDSAVASVNSLVATYLICIHAQITNALSALTSSRATKILDHTIANNGLSEYITDAKEKAIVYLEQELKRLKEE